MTQQITKAKAEVVSAEIQEAVEAILERHGISKGKIKYGYGAWFEWKITATAFEEGLNGVNMASREASYYTQFGWTAYGQAPNYEQTQLTAPLGTKFVSNGKEYVFAGVDAKKRKYPIFAVEADTQKPMYFTETVITKINRAARVTV
jgi:hypothetical protein